MTQIAPGAAVLRKPYGCMVPQTVSGELTIDLRLSAWDIGSMPRSCEVDLRLPAWESSPVFAIALLMRLGRNPSATYQAWINAGDEDALQVLKSLGQKSDILVRLVDNEVVRAVRTTNHIYRRAFDLYRRVSPRLGDWTRDEYDRVIRRVDGLYPTIGELWRAATDDSIRKL